MSEEAHVQPCKGCGETPTAHHDGYRYHIMCEKCYHCTMDERLDSAVKIWNREYGDWMNYGS